MKFDKFSKKQLAVLTWWTKSSKYSNKKGIICTGAIRAGKTLSMSISFIIWAMSNYSGQQFGMSGKTAGAFERNVLFWTIPVLKARGYTIIKKDNILSISIKNKDTGKKVTNHFFIFGGRDERSYTLIQGMTCAGWFFDEVALQPESFVNQAIGRCSVKGSKLWFNCNPDKPNHWFKVDFIDKAKEKDLLCIHFLMYDNPSLDKETITDYENRFTGLFYLRYIKGLWALAEGIIYDMFNKSNTYNTLDERTKLESTRYFAIDYGVTNPFVVLDIYDHWEVAYQEKEIYYDNKEHNGRQLTDEQMADMIDDLAKSEPYPVSRIIIDPSATSLKVVLRNRGYLLKDADNDVLEGIKVTSSAFYQQRYLINNNCKYTKKEIQGYVWDSKAKDRGEEKPVKIDDHACVTGDTLIETIKGKIPIKDLVNTEGKCYCINTKTKRKAIGNFKNVCCTGKNKDIYKIKLSNNTEIKLTADHLVLTEKGWKQVKDLTIYDKVVKINYVK